MGKVKVWEHVDVVIHAGGFPGCITGEFGAGNEDNSAKGDLGS